MRRTVYTAVVLLVNLVAATWAVAQVQITASAFVEPSISDFDSKAISIPGSETVAVSANGYSSFGHAYATATAGTNWLTGNGLAMAGSPDPEPVYGSGTSSLSYTFGVATPTQMRFSFQLAVPNYDIAEYSASATVEFRQTSPGNTIIFQPNVYQPGDRIGGEQMLLLPEGNYRWTADAWAGTFVDFSNPVGMYPPGASEWRFSLEFFDGSSQALAFLPTGQVPGGMGWLFDGLPPGWYDPVLAHGFDFEMLSEDAFFTSTEMPVGLGDPNGYILTYLDGLDLVAVPLDEGESYDFPAGVSSFKILDIGPPFDPDDPQAFPIYLDFSTPTASFSMTPILVPEPSSLALLALGGLGLLAWRRRAR